jgi:hypothetical protein
MQIGNCQKSHDNLHNARTARFASAGILLYRLPGRQ